MFGGLYVPMVRKWHGASSGMGAEDTMYPDIYISRQSRRVGIITFASMALVSFLNVGHILAEAWIFALLSAIIAAYGTAVALDW